MPDENRKLMKCVSCNTTYNVTSLKPGSKFKCKKCGVINTVAPGPVPDVAPVAVNVAPKSAQSRMSKPMSRANLYQRGKSSGLSRIKSDAGITDEAPPPKSKTPLIIGISAGVVVLGIIIYCVTSSGSKTPPAEESLATASAKTVETPPLVVEKLPEWNVDPKIKAEVEELLRSLKAADENTMDYQKIRLTLHNKDKAALPSLIDLLNSPDEGIAQEAMKQLEWRTNLSYNPGDGTKLPMATLFDKWKKWWLNEQNSLLLPDKTQILLTPPKPKATEAPPELVVDEALKAEIEPLLQKMRMQSDSDNQATTDQIMAKGNSAIPVLIKAIGNQDDWVARYASEILIKITKREDAPTVNQMVPYDSRQTIMHEWEDWWRENQDKFPIQ
jgi:flagellar basal body-associated protein FliL